MSTAQELLKRIQAQKVELALLQKQKDTAYERILQADEEEACAIEAREVVKKVALETQKELEFRFSNIVTTALASILEEPYEFQARFVERRNTMECDLSLILDGVEYHPVHSVGGGIADIVSFALRISYWALKPTRNVFLLDEPFKFLSASYHEKASKLLKLLSTEMNIQFVMVSHLSEMISHADRAFFLKNGYIKEIF